MKTKRTILIAGLLLALVVVGVAGASRAYAQSSSSTLFHGRGPGDGHGLHLGTAELEAAAKVLNMTADELSNELKSGKTLEQIASDASVDFAEVQAAIQAAHTTELRDRIEQALKDGTITQENADWLLEGLDKGFIGVPGAFGLGGPHGSGPDKVPTTPQPTQTSGG